MKSMDIYKAALSVQNICLFLLQVDDISMKPNIQGSSSWLKLMPSQQIDVVHSCPCGDVPESLLLFLEGNMVRLVTGK